MAVLATISGKADPARIVSKRENEANLSVLHSSTLAVRNGILLISMTQTDVVDADGMTLKSGDVS